jgi:hypothetical protein
MFRLRRYLRPTLDVQRYRGGRIGLRLMRKLVLHAEARDAP